MNYENILYAVDNKVARITLNRPAALNAMTIGLMEDVAAALRQAEADSNVAVVLLTGAGKGFCSGADLAATTETAPRDADGKLNLGEYLTRYYNPLIVQMHSLSKPIIAMVNGIAAGAGCSLALMADLTIAARSAKFLQAFVNVGLMPDAGGTWILPRNTGSQRAMGMAMLGERITAEQAAAWGMIWQVVDDAALEETATAMASKLANGPALALARIKRSIYAAAGNALEPQLQLEAELQAECGRSEDFMEGAVAFLEKRKANFKGK